MNTIIGMLYNAKLQRWHPILFMESPMPGGQFESGATRYKSKGHHTAGFSTREEAVDSAKGIGENISAKLSIEKDFPWDGEGVPAMVVFFSNEGMPLF